MKKKFEKPVIEITQIEDVLKTSNDLFSNGVCIGGVDAENVNLSPERYW